MNNPTTQCSTSTPALYLSNWQDLMAMWEASQRTQTDTPRMPRIGELHYFGDSAYPAATNQIKAYAGYFRDESAGGVKYTAAGEIDAQAWFESDSKNAGTVTTKYIAFGKSAAPRVNIYRSFVAVPNQPFLVIRYTIENPTDESIEFNVLDRLHLKNFATPVLPPKPVHGSYDSERNALFADRSKSGHPTIVLGAFQGMDSFQVGNASKDEISDPRCSGLHSFEADGTLKNNKDLVADDVELAFQKKLTLNPRGGKEELYFYLSVQRDPVSAANVADAAQKKSGGDWFSYTAKKYTYWLGKGKRLDTNDELKKTCDCSLILIKNCQNPKLGTLPATTNPFAYGYKTWARDASITAMALDASGHHEEAAAYWKWMANVQRPDGTWATTYSFWDGSYMQFVEPEYDSVGAFLYGVYRHYDMTHDEKFLAVVEPAVKKAADWILHNLQPNGFGAADFSIWEEPERGLEHNVFTQAWYVAGLYAAQKLYESQGNTDLADWLAGGPASILTAMQRPIGWQPPGLWNPQGYYIRAVNQDGTVQTLHDSSSNILFALGVIDVESGRWAKHVNSMINLLTHEKYGIGRYERDEYYEVNPYDPAEDEAHGTCPMWPQMSNWIAIYEALADQRENALARLHWYVDVNGIGSTPPGEAVSYVTRRPITSSMSEPLTAASFILAALVYEKQYDLRISPPVHKAGAWKKIAINGDRQQWQDVPYFTGRQPASTDSSAMTGVKRVYLANDDANLYLRIDHPAGSDAEPIAARVYSGDFASDAPSTTTGLAGKSLSRPVSLVFEGPSSSLQSASLFSEGQWMELPDCSDTRLKWGVSSGRIEAVVPISALWSKGKEHLVLGNSLAPLIVTLGRHEADHWTEIDRLLIHYRLSGQHQPWIYGNIEQ